MTVDQEILSFATYMEQLSEDGRKKAMRAVKAKVTNQDAEAFEPPVRTLGEYLNTPIEIPPSLVWPTIVVRGELTATLGRAGYGKTTMNLNRILKWGAGLPLFDTFSDSEGRPYLMPDKPLRILIIENEGSAGMFHSKVGIMLNSSGRMFTDEQRQLVRDNVLVWGDGGYSGLKIDDPAILNQVRAGVEKHEPDVVFVEPFRSLWKGEENSSTDMAIVTDNLVALATDYGCGVILSHHERKSGAGEDGELMSAGRGSTVLEGVVAVMENFQKVVGGDYRELTWSKSRYLREPPPGRLEYDPDTLWYRHVSVDEIDEAVMLALRNNLEDPMTLKQLAEELQENERKLRPIMTRLCSEDRVKKMKSTSDGNGSTGLRYRLPSGGSDDSEGIPL